MGILIVLAVVWLLFGGLGWWVAEQKSRPGEEGLVLGVLFGPLGVLVEALLPDQRGDAAAVDEPTEEEKQRAALDARRRLAEEREAREAEEIIQAELAARRAAERAAWVEREILGFAWFHRMPDWAQSVLVGVAVAVPIVALIVQAMR